MRWLQLQFDFNSLQRCLTAIQRQMTVQLSSICSCNHCLSWLL